MCGIVGYIGKRDNPRIGLEALKRLEYRGYDSAGSAWFDLQKKRIFVLKAVGKIKKLEEKFPSAKISARPFIFHTRWGSHGQITEANAHPHWDCKKNVFLVHNGIVENYQDLKENLIKEGHRFRSQTDTEVLAHLIEKFFAGNLEKAVKKALALVRGTYSLAIIASKDPEKLVLARNSSPLLIGLGDNEFFAASDPSAVIAHTKKVIYLDDGDMAVLTPSQYSIKNLEHKPKFGKAKQGARREQSSLLAPSGARGGRSPQRGKTKKIIHEIDWDLQEAQKGGYPHFMLKEIMEQPESLANALRGRLIPRYGAVKLGGLEQVSDKLRQAERLNVIACGTAYLAGLVGEYMLEEYAGIPTEVDLASEFRYRKPILDKKTASIFISQSGETLDTLAALKEVKRKGGLSLAIVNVVGSSVTRETDAGIYNHAGPEIGVASTKTFTSQLTLLALLTLFLGRQRDMSLVTGTRLVKELSRLPSLAQETLKKTLPLAKKLAKKYHRADNFLFIGRKYNYPIALEGALKLKEISYIHAEGYGAGEMKHGPIALIDKNFPTFALCPSDSVYEKAVSNIQEIKARKGPVIALATEGNQEIKKMADDVLYIPKTLEMLTPILAVIPLQLFAYHMASQRGCEIDTPRNLAKSVTVE